MAWVLASSAGTFTALPGADGHTPAEFEVLPTLAHPDQQAWDVTTGLGPINQVWRFNAPYEPFIFRTKSSLAADNASGSGIPLMHQNDFGMQEGALDGATVRIYRLSDGDLRKVCERTIAEGGHQASGWQPAYKFFKSVVIDPATTTAYFGFRDAAKLDHEYYFSVASVDQDGLLTYSDEYVALTPLVAGRSAAPASDIITVSLPHVDTTGSVSAPSNIQVTVDAAGVITYAWDAVVDANLKGYLPVLSDVPPSQFKGFGLDFTEAAPPLLAGDMMFLEQRRLQWSRSENLRMDDYNNRRAGTGRRNRPRTKCWCITTYN